MFHFLQVPLTPPARLTPQSCVNSCLPSPVTSQPFWLPQPQPLCCSIAKPSFATTAPPAPTNFLQQIQDLKSFSPYCLTFPCPSLANSLQCHICWGPEAAALQSLQTVSHGWPSPTGRAMRAVLCHCDLSVLTIYMLTAALWHNQAATIIYLRPETKGTLQKTHPLPGEHAVEASSEGFRMRGNGMQQTPASCHCLCPGPSPRILKTLCQ